MKKYDSLFLFISFTFLLFSCKQEQNVQPGTVTFNVGFESVKTHQGVCIDKETGKEEIYFVKLQFNPFIRFYDLDGNPTDSISLAKLEKDIGVIGSVSLLSKDTIVAAFYRDVKLAAIKRDGTYLCRIDLDSLSCLVNSNVKYHFWGSLQPCTFMHKDNAFFMPVCADNDFEEDLPAFELFKIMYGQYIMHTPGICKIESIFSEHPKIIFGLKDYFYTLSDTLKQYYAPTYNTCVILNNKIFYANSYDRNMYGVNPLTLLVEDTLQVIPQEYPIMRAPALLKEEDCVMDSSLEKMKHKKTSYIANLLYDSKKYKYYVFLKVGENKADIDELGYAFKLFIYDGEFQKEKEIFFDTDEYLPHSAMMTSRGIMIEKITKETKYGKRIFEFLDI